MLKFLSEALIFTEDETVFQELGQRRDNHEIFVACQCPEPALWLTLAVFEVKLPSLLWDSLVKKKTKPAIQGLFSI